MIHQDESLLAETRKLRCTWCGADPPNDPHHLFGRGMDGGMRIEVWWNLVPLCRTCHSKVDAGPITREKLCESALQHHFFRLQRMPKEAHEVFAEIMEQYSTLMRLHP